MILPFFKLRSLCERIDILRGTKYRYITFQQNDPGVLRQGGRAPFDNTKKGLSMAFPNCEGHAEDWQNDARNLNEIAPIGWNDVSEHHYPGNKRVGRTDGENIFCCEPDDCKHNYDNDAGDNDHTIRSQ